ncbi:MAG TPA: FecR domain-containing protein [Pedobacter sp.]|uniref:FecR family protein n=1 Tax=Pedobacter sp. TaxID=1411316 RepID=UPI002BB437C0|nr:FecR domain-containing protein [Pedobacter sp.]HMI05048.1 FecR domain-containing protein [Pedobacter sp.]
MERENTEEQTAKYRLHYFRKKDIPVLSETELEAESDLVYGSLMKAQAARTLKTRKLWYPAAAAAAVLIIAGACLFSYNSKTNIKPVIDSRVSKKPSNDVAPGVQTATLTLANGVKIALSEAANGKIAEQNGVSISKTADGKLIYSFAKFNKKINALSNVFNTLSTVKGQQYQVILPDGSKVWLNAASSITYPANFANLKNRMVQLSGEAYFEVAKDKSHPFIVKTDRQQVEVLGTHFNVNSYGDEGATRTTLLEGSVKILSDKGQKVLLPGQQSQLAKNTLKVSSADVNETVAWKNGDFIFNNEAFGSILRQLSRWYNVEIIDNGSHSELHLSGTISRSKNMSTVLKALEVTGKVKFKIEGKTVVVE